MPQDSDYRRSGGALAEQWQWLQQDMPTSGRLRMMILQDTRALKHALSQLAVDVLVNAPSTRRRESSKQVLTRAAALESTARKLVDSGVRWTPEVRTELAQMSEHASAVGRTQAPDTHALEALRLSYRALRVAMGPHLPSELVVEGVPGRTWLTS